VEKVIEDSNSDFSKLLIAKLSKALKDKNIITASLYGKQ